MKNLMMTVVLMVMCCVIISCGKEEEKKGSIYGVVTDYSTNEPVSGANVQLRPSGETTLTGADGMYEILDVSNGEYSITVSKAGYTDLVDDYVITVKDGKKMRRDVQIKPLPSSLHIYDNESHEISELDFGADVGVIKRTFNIFNGGTRKIDYEIEQSVDWITNISQPSGTIDVGVTKPIVVTINRKLLAIGDNTTTLLITSSADGGRELVVKARKDGELPEVSIVEAVAIDSVSYRIKCEVLNDGGQEVVERGICWSTVGDPTMDDDTIRHKNGGVGQYIILMEHLNMATHYYVRAYAKNELGASLSDMVEFVTEAIVTLPIVATIEVHDVTATSVVCKGDVINDGGTDLIERGVCWGTSANPSISGQHQVAFGATIGEFSVSITGLTSNTTFHVRAYAKNTRGTAYGDDLTFTTLEYLPSVTTASITDITTTSAKSGGIVTSQGASSVTERGLCWNTEHNPTVNDSHVNSGTGTGSYSCNMTGLTSNTTYYVRAYATNSAGTAYGNEISFTTLSPQTPPGAINSLFSASYNQQVLFSQGNLQYQASSNTWRFAENQYDYVGEANANISSSYSGWIDLFGWGTSGYAHGAVCYQPWSTSITYSNYYAYGISTYSLYDQTGQADWGYNPILNGGNQENNGWRMLTHDEWEYVINTRATVSGIRYAKACVNNVNGLLLLPDDWDPSIFHLNSTNVYDASYLTNSINNTIWNNYLAPNGCVFLPATGYRRETSVNLTGFYGGYWSSDFLSSDKAYSVHFSDSDLIPGNWGYRNDGLPVRLVRPIQ